MSEARPASVGRASLISRLLLKLSSAGHGIEIMPRIPLGDPCSSMGHRAGGGIKEVPGPVLALKPLNHFPVLVIPDPLATIRAQVHISPLALDRERGHAEG